MAAVGFKGAESSSFPSLTNAPSTSSPYLKSLASGVAPHAALQHQHRFHPPLRHDTQLAVGHFLGARQVQAHGRHLGSLGGSLLPALGHGRFGAGLACFMITGGGAVGEVTTTLRYTSIHWYDRTECFRGTKYRISSASYEIFLCLLTNSISSK